MGAPLDDLPKFPGAVGTFATREEKEKPLIYGGKSMKKSKSITRDRSGFHGLRSATRRETEQMIKFNKTTTAYIVA